MTEYATLRELETTALEYREDLLGEDKSMDIVAARVGKILQPMGELDRIVLVITPDYFNAHQGPHFELRDIPKLWRYLAGMFVPDDKMDAWLNDREAFNGLSPRQKLSVLEPAGLQSNVNEVANVFYESLAFATVPPLPSSEQLLYVTRLAQAEQLQRK